LLDVCVQQRSVEQFGRAHAVRVIGTLKLTLRVRTPTRFACSARPVRYRLRCPLSHRDLSYNHLEGGLRAALSSTKLEGLCVPTDERSHCFVCGACAPPLGRLEYAVAQQSMHVQLRSVEQVHGPNPCRGVFAHRSDANVRAVAIRLLVGAADL
jgi:hypothetical protein